VSTDPDRRQTALHVWRFGFFVRVEGGRGNVDMEAEKERTRGGK
jgi:hypothetical protein